MFPVFRILFRLTVMILCLSGCRETTPVVPVPAAGEAQTPPLSNEQNSSSVLSQLAQPYRGITIRGVSENTPASAYVRDILAPAFEAETGIKVILEIMAHDQMYTLSVQDMVSSTGYYDFVYIEQDLVYDYLERGFLINLSQALRQQTDLVLPGFNTLDFTSFINEFKAPDSGDIYGIPIEAFPKIYLYRKDLFEDPTIQAAFLKTYNYPLAPAVTIQQYRDIASFFTQYGQENSLDLWGTTVQGVIDHPASIYEFLETIAPAFGVYNWGISLDHYQASTANGGKLNSEQAKAALTFWLDMLAYAPPNASQSTWDEVAETFAAGQAAQGWIYGENAAWIAVDPDRSKVAGNVGMALPPTASGVIEDALVGSGYLGYYDGAAFGISHASQQQEATLLWLQFLGLPHIQPAWATASGRVVHLSTFDDPLVQAQDKKLSGYYSLMKNQGRLFAGAPPFPFHVTIRDTIAPYIHQAIAGDLSADEALEQAAMAVDEALNRLGYGLD